MDKVAVVILNWNGVDLLRKFLPSVLSCSSEGSLYVIDNGSTDDSCKFLAEEYPSIKQICLDKNYGFAGGYNNGLKSIEADYFVLLNSDVEVTEGWLSPMVNLLDENPDIAAVQPKILSYRDRTKFEHAGAGGGGIDRFGYPFCRGRMFDICATDSGQFDDTSQIFWSSGAAMMIRSSSWRAAGGFDGDFFAHMEEIDLCWRLHHLGQQVFYCGESKVYHLGGGTLPYSSPKKLFLNFRNNLWMLYKNCDGLFWLFIILFRMILDGVSALFFLSKGEFSGIITIFKAHCALYSSLGRLSVKRAAVMRSSVNRKYPIYRGSIVWDHFVKRKDQIDSIR